MKQTLTQLNYNSLEEFYLYAEKNASKPRKHSDLGRHLKALSEQTENEEIKEKLKWEILVFDFVLEDGKSKPVMSSTLEDGTAYEYPSYNGLTDEMYLYLKQRAETVKNDFLIARYNQILWNSNSKYKHFQQPQQCVDANLRLLNKLNFYSERELSGWEFMQIFENSFHISVFIKYRTEEHKELIKSFLFSNGKLRPHWKIRLLEFMVKMPQFKKVDFEKTLDLVKKIAQNHQKDKTDYFQIKDILEAGLSIARKCGTDTKIWNKRIGDALVRMAEFRMDDKSKMIPLKFYQEALVYYKLAGLEKKVKEIEAIYSELRKELRLSKIPIELGEKHGKQLYNYIEAKTNALLEHAPEQIFGYLLTGKDIFPDKKWLENSFKNENSFLDVFSTIRFDINHNIGSERNDKASKIKSKVYEIYHLHTQSFVLHQLHRIFIEGIKRNKITYETLMQFIFEEYLARSGIG